MRPLSFTKVQNVGNDFILIDYDEILKAFSLDQADANAETILSALASKACHRHFGVGSDGLIVSRAVRGRVEVRMFNPDGTEDFCGNGLHSVALYYFQRCLCCKELEIDHYGNRVHAAIQEDGSVLVKLPPASFAPEDVPLKGGIQEIFLKNVELEGELWTISSLSVGTTHTVILVATLPENTKFFKVSEYLVSHENYPDRTSVIWVVPLSERHLKIRIFERGVGETFGCGSGSAAAAAVWSRKNGLTGSLILENPGGDLLFRVQGWHKPMEFVSSPREVFCGTLPVEFLKEIRDRRPMMEKNFFTSFF